MSILDLCGVQVGAFRPGYLLNIGEMVIALEKKQPLEYNRLVVISKSRNYITLRAVSLEPTKDEQVPANHLYVTNEKFLV